MAEQKVKLTQLPEATDTIDTAVLLVNQNETDQQLPVTHFLRSKNNLSELENTAQARANLGVPSVEDVNDKIEYLIDGKSTFLNGATLESERDFIWDDNSKSWYYWTGAFSKEVPAASTPESTGGIGPGKWLSVGDATLRGQISDPDGATKYPELQIARWRDEGDIRGWGAACDGITDDTLSIKSAVADTGGKITIPGNVFVTGVIDFTGLSNPRVKFINGSMLSIDTTFQFTARHRAPLSFYQCLNPTVTDAYISGAKLDKIGFPGVDPIQDGDAGIEYIECTGICRTTRFNIFNVKTWGVIHVNVDGYVVEDGYVENCQVQSGVGCTGSKWGIIENIRVNYAGLYGIELETVGGNLLTQVTGGLITNSRNALNVVNNSKNINVNGLHAVNCVYGLCGEGPVSQPTNLIFSNCIATSCRSGYLLRNVSNATINGCRTDRDETEFFTRVNALDRVYSFDPDTSTASIPNSVSMTPGEVIEFDNGVKRTVSLVGVSSDPTFGDMTTFTTTVPLTSDCLRRSFRRYIEVVNAKHGVYIIDGINYSITGCEFHQDTDLIYSSGNHNNFVWVNNTAFSVAKYFTQINGGIVSGKIVINPSNCVNIGSWNQTTKFIPAFSTIRSFNYKGGTNSETKTVNAAFIEEGVIGGVSCAINGTPTTTGTITLKLNGTDVISGGFTGSPYRKSVTLGSPIAVSGAATIQLTDTIGDIVASGYSVQLRGVFR